ncbi:MAG: class I SAM-dependent methyltransferase [Proteobacteria bacterium]|jgi:ribosomal protein L11 methylase PrmA|nr:class I SAM-dependent methyltransferase [Pseudomonadota bacterium]
MKSAFSHWDKVYTTKKHSQVSWHQDHATISLDWIIEVIQPNDAIIDVGCGVSVLADNLLDKGFSDLSLLELSSIALKSTQKRLVSNLNKVSFYHQNILDFSTKKYFKLWHDRAVFHFLTDPNDQKTYIQKLNDYLQKDGFFLLATFALDGPKQCSELDIVQYDEKKISRLLSKNFKLIKTVTESHVKPNGGVQKFNYFLLQKQ